MSQIIKMQSEEIEELIQKTARKTVEELKEEERKEKEKLRFHETLNLMHSYRDAVFHIENIAGSKTTGQKEDYLHNVEKNKLRTMLMIENINKVVDEVAKRRIQAGREQEYKVFQMYFMQGLTYEQILDELERETGEKLGKNTPRRWVLAFIKDMDILLWGIHDSI